jgi:hypothetical protein
MIDSLALVSRFGLALGACALAASAGLGASPASAASPALAHFELKLRPQHGSGIAGTATIVHAPSPPGNVTVTIVLDGVFVPENRYPAGVYGGTCAKLPASPAYRLAPVVGGRSTTRLRGVKPPVSGPYAIAVFRTDGSQTMSCGELPIMKHSHER